jgi:hypothetical protein
MDMPQDMWAVDNHSRGDYNGHLPQDMWAVDNHSRGDYNKNFSAAGAYFNLKTRVIYQLNRK